MREGRSPNMEQVEEEELAWTMLREDNGWCWIDLHLKLHHRQQNSLNSDKQK